MTIWTTFCPSKVCWELTFLYTKGKSPTSNWLANKELIKKSLQLLKKSGIKGIRLVIFPSEVTEEGKRFDWSAFETMLSFCKDLSLAVDVCLGPYQYPHYPGIYLPRELMIHIFDNDNTLDTNPVLRRYGIKFLQVQLEKYGDDKRIHGFHLANEWPDAQNIAGKEQLKKGVSEDFMTGAATLVKSLTSKPLSLNTNIDVSKRKKLIGVFASILAIFGEQGNLGFDIYPSQDTWLKTPFIKLRRLFEPYPYAFRMIKKRFSSCELFFAEVEAQPWGNGQAWFTLISQEINPQQKVLSYSRDSLPKTWKKYIAGARCERISLWGADFWLVAHEMDLFWPLEQIKRL